MAAENIPIDLILKPVIEEPGREPSTSFTASGFRWN
jgi:hypothetical protein